MKRINILAGVLLISAMLTSCGERVSQAPETRIVYAMDTAITLTAYGEAAAGALEASEEEIHNIDEKMSRASETGDIYPLNASGEGRVSDETAYVIEKAVEIGGSTGGAFDITIAPVMDLWGFFGHEYRVPSEDELTEQLVKVDYRNISVSGNDITLDNGAAIDLGGIAKGYASDRVKEVFEKHGILSGLISFGSAIQAVGSRPDGSDWRIGITDPQNTEEHIAILAMSDKCIATSGSYEQAFEENGQTYHHIIDPSTGYPANSGLASVSIICDNAAEADGLSTALFVMGLNQAEKYWRENGGFDAVFVTNDNEVYYTEGIAGSFSAADGASAVMITK